MLIELFILLIIKIVLIYLSKTYGLTLAESIIIAESIKNDRTILMSKKRDKIQMKKSKYTFFDSKKDHYFF